MIKYKTRFNEDLLPGGKGDDKPDKDFKPDQLKKGIEHESEHTQDKAIQKEIAKDHLSENPNYYDELDMIESYQSKFAESITYEEETLTERLLSMIEKVKMNLLDVAEISTEYNEYAQRTGNATEESEIVEELVLQYKGAGDKLINALYRFLAKRD